MKRITAILLAVVMVLSICSVFSFAEGSVNLALNCPVTGADPSTHVANANYGGSLTDGKAADGSAIGTAGEWFCYYYNPDAAPETWNVEDTATKTANAVIDLGEVCSVESVRVHVFTGNHWGIIAPDSITAYVSADGENYTEVGTKSYAKVDSELMQEEWSEFALSAATGARYVKVKVVLMGYFAFLNEIEVMGTKGGEVTPPAPVAETIEVDGKLDDNGWKADGWVSFDETNSSDQALDSTGHIGGKYQIRVDDEWVYVALDYNNAITRGAGNGKSTNLRTWIHNGDADAKMYTNFYDVYVNADGVVSTNSKYNTSKTENKAANIEVPSIVAAVDETAGTIEYKVKLSEINETGEFELRFGLSDIVNADGSNMSILYPNVGKNGTDNFPYRLWYEGAVKVDASLALGEVEAPSEGTDPVVGEKKSFWLTHVDDGSTCEGSGVVCKVADVGGPWWCHYAFSPVAGLENVYEITEISTHGGNGSGQKLAVPEGGFVYTINTGNDYPALYEESVANGNPNENYKDKPNYKSAGVVAMDALKETFEVGGMYLIENIDAVPAENEGKNYWEEGWVVNATIATYVPGTKPADPQQPEEPEVDYNELLGEANENANFELEVVLPENYTAGEQIVVKIVIKNVGSKISGLLFNLNYDASKVEPVVKNDQASMNAAMGEFLTKAPASWNNQDFICMLEEDDQYYSLSFCTFNDTEAVGDGELEIEVPFTVKEGATGDVVFYIDHANIAGNIAGADCVGNGSFGVSKLPAEDPGTSDPGTSDPGNDPSTGDMGVVALVVLALVAVIGSAVVVKARN